MERQLLEGGEGALGPPVTLFGELFDARPVYGDDAELACDEETVGEDEKKDGDYAQYGFYVRSPHGITRGQE